MKLITLIAIPWLLIAAYAINLYKFIRCDFEPSYKAEAIYGIGIFTPTFVVTAWMDIK
jgi:hypothetical protein